MPFLQEMKSLHISNLWLSVLIVENKPLDHGNGEKKVAFCDYLIYYAS